MRTTNFSETFIDDFFVNNFGKSYLHKKNIIKNSQNIMNLSILNEVLSKRSYWNNKTLIWYWIDNPSITRISLP